MMILYYYINNYILVFIIIYGPFNLTFCFILIVIYNINKITYIFLL